MGVGGRDCVEWAMRVSKDREVGVSEEASDGYSLMGSGQVTIRFPKLFRLRRQ
jgi:hypothetical protein